jgi:hypothetical protein
MRSRARGRWLELIVHDATDDRHYSLNHRGELVVRPPREPHRRASRPLAVPLRRAVLVFNRDSPGSDGQTFTPSPSIRPPPLPFESLGETPSSDEDVQTYEIPVNDDFSCDEGGVVP